MEDEERLVSTQPEPQRWRRELNLIYTSVVGMLIAVSWAYLLQQQVDPNSKCPAQGCWPLVIVLGVNTVLGAFYIPRISLFLMRQLRSQGSLFKVAATQRLQQLATDASGTCFSVSASSFVYFLLKQLEFAASGGNGESFVRPVAHAGDTAARRHLVAHRLPVLFACFGVCCGVVVVSLFAMIFATRRLQFETRPYWVEVWLLLRSQLVYASAYAVASMLGLLLFQTFELATRATMMLFFATVVRAVGLFFISRYAARKLPRPPDDADAVAHASASVKACAALLCFNGAAVVASIGVHDAIVFLPLSLLPLTSSARMLVLFPYAVVALAAVVYRRTLPKPTKRHPNDEPFILVFEAWLVYFAWWVPYKLLFVAAWDLLRVRSTPPDHGAAHIAAYVALRVLRFLWQLVLALAFLFVFAALTALPEVLAAIRHQGRCFFPGLFGHPSTSSALDDAFLGDEDDEITTTNPLQPDDASSQARIAHEDANMDGDVELPPHIGADRRPSDLYSFDEESGTRDALFPPPPVRRDRTA